MMQEIKMLKQPVRAIDIFDDSEILMNEGQRKNFIGLFFGELFNA